MKKMLPLLGIFLGVHTAFAQTSSRDFNFSADCNRAQTSAVLSFNGDILIHDGLYQYVYSGKQDFSVLWSRTNSLINKADYSVANLEGPAALGIDNTGRDRGDVGFTYDKIVYSGTNFSFNFHPRILGDLKKSGYDLLTMANNHALDRRGLGIDRTLEAAKSTGIPTVGTRLSYDKDAQFYHVASIRGINVAFISCTEMTNGMPDKNNQVLFCFRNADKISHMASVLSQHPAIDAVIILPHWGVEYATSPNGTQKIFARKWLDAGATAVVGSHPHVLQPWEKYVTADGRETVIMYSLGNFLAFQAGVEKKTGVVTYLGLSKEGSRTKVSAVGYTPTYRDSYFVDPISSTESAGALTAARNFGTLNRIAPKASLSGRFCR